MEKIKRILALIGVIILASLYLTTLFFAIFEDSKTMNFFITSVVATVILPVLLWAYSMIYRLLKSHYSEPTSGRSTQQATETDDVSDNSTR